MGFELLGEVHLLPAVANGHAVVVGELEQLVAGEDVQELAGGLSPTSSRRISGTWRAC